MTEVNFTFRVETDLKEQFMHAARTKDRKASLLLRDFMRHYVAESASVLEPQAKAPAKRPKKSAARAKKSPAKHA